MEVIQKLYNNNYFVVERSLYLITNTDRWGRRSGRGGGLVGREDDERLILNLLDNDLFLTNAFVTRNYHSFGGGSLEKLGGEGRDSKLLYPHNFSKDSIVTKRRETRGEEGGGGGQLRPAT